MLIVANRVEQHLHYGPPPQSGSHCIGWRCTGTSRWRLWWTSCSTNGPGYHSCRTCVLVAQTNNLHIFHFKWQQSLMKDSNRQYLTFYNPAKASTVKKGKKNCKFRQKEQLGLDYRHGISNPHTSAWGSFTIVVEAVG